MTLNQLRSFLAVADSGSVRAAAEELVVTQAAVSASLAALQKSLGVALVTPGRPRAAADRRRGVLRPATRAASWACSTRRAGPRRPPPTPSAASCGSPRSPPRPSRSCPRILGGFRRRHPQTGVRLEAGNRDRVRALLDRHQVDLVLGGRPEPGWDVRGPRACAPHELVVVAAPELAAAGSRHAGQGAGQPRCPGWPARPGFCASRARAPAPAPTPSSPTSTSPR